VLNDLVFVILNLSDRGHHGHELSELLTKIIDAVIGNLEEKEGFGLLGKTRPVKNKSE
jgi:hypothetical protein